MTSEVVNEYILELLATDSEDAFHCLVESGEDCVVSVIEHLQNANDFGDRSCLIDVLKEVRTPSVIQYLDEQLRAAKSFEEWKLVAEARCYNDEKSAVLVFQHERTRLVEEGRGKEASFYDSFLS
jgi:hypothetical protein